MTYIIRASRLEVGGATEELFQDWEQTVALHTSLQTSQKLEIELRVPPLALADLGFGRLGQLRQDLVNELGLQGVDDEKNGGHEGGLQGLLQSQLHRQVKEGVPQVFILVVVGHHVGDRLDFLVPSSQGRVRNAEELSSDSYWQGRGVYSPSLVAAIVVVIVI